MGRGEDQLRLQLGQLSPQLLDVLCPAPAPAAPLLLLLGLEDRVSEGGGRGLQRHQAGWPRLPRLTARLLHNQDLQNEIENILPSLD